MMKMVNIKIAIFFVLMILINEKKGKLKENIQYLEKLSNDLDKSIVELKAIYEKISEQKEELKTKLQKIFTKLRNELNDREDQLLEEVKISLKKFL